MYQNVKNAELRPHNLESEPDERSALYPWHEADGAPGCGGHRGLPNRNDLFRNYPELEPEDVRQALAFAAANLEFGLGILQTLPLALIRDTQHLLGLRQYFSIGSTSRRIGRLTSTFMIVCETF